MSQVQQASQTTVNLQTLGASAQQASQLETPGPATPPSPTSTITQIQIGCLTQCFGTTTTSQVSEPVAQQILGVLTSLVPPDGSSTPAPAPGTDQSVVDQVSCQVQTGEPAPGTAVQTASQTSTTVQLINLLPLPSGGTQTSGAPTVNQTEQQTWQLQIGCLFYCTATQQVQQAQQTITTIQVLVGQPVPSTPPTTGAVTGTSQVIWQVQIGCVAWCYDATQVQDAASQATVTVITLIPPAPTPPPVAPPAGTAASSAGGPATGQAGAVVGTASTPTTAPTAASASPPTPLVPSLTRVGIVVIERRPNAIAVPAVAPSPTPAAPVSTGSTAPVSTGPAAPVSTGPTAPVAAGHTDVLSTSGAARWTAPHAVVPHAVRLMSASPRRREHSASADARPQTASVEAATAQPDWMPWTLFAGLGVVAAAVFWALGGAQPRRRER